MKGPHLKKNNDKRILSTHAMTPQPTQALMSQRDKPVDTMRQKNLPTPTICYINIRNPNQKQIDNTSNHLAENKR